MEVRVGVLHVTREIAFESDQSPEDIEDAVRQALDTKAELLTLVDQKGRRVLVPTERLGYIEIGPPAERRIGFTVT